MAPAQELPPVPPIAGPLAAPARLALVAAVAANGVIGAGLAIPWRLPADLRFFRALTTGHTIVMGRRTWQSLPHALPGRQNIVVSRDAAFVAPGAEVAPGLAAAVALASLPAPVFVIGGAVLYAAALPLADALYITEIAGEYTGDVVFPPFDRGHWCETVRLSYPAVGEAPAHAFVRYDRIPARA